MTHRTCLPTMPCRKTPRLATFSSRFAMSSWLSKHLADTWNIDCGMVKPSRQRMGGFFPQGMMGRHAGQTKKTFFGLHWQTMPKKVQRIMIHRFLLFLWRLNYAWRYHAVQDTPYFIFPYRLWLLQIFLTSSTKKKKKKGIRLEVSPKFNPKTSPHLLSLKQFGVISSPQDTCAPIAHLQLQASHHFPMPLEFEPFHPLAVLIFMLSDNSWQKINKMFLPLFSVCIAPSMFLGPGVSEGKYINKKRSEET